MSNPLSPELISKIEKDAEHYANVQVGEKAKFIGHHLSHRWDDAKGDYESGAFSLSDKLAAAEQQLEQMAKALDAIIGTNHDNHEKVILKTKAIASQALTDYQTYKKGKDGEAGTNNNG